MNTIIHCVSFSVSCHLPQGQAFGHVDQFFQDQVYYEKMVEWYAKKSGKSFDLEIKAHGFREMPDKLGVAFRTGQGIPDLVQLDETFSAFSQWSVPS